MLKDDKLNVFNFQKRCCLHIVVTTDATSWNTTRALRWQTVHEHIVTDPFHSKMSSSVLLVHEQQGPQKQCPSRRHSATC